MSHHTAASRPPDVQQNAAQENRGTRHQQSYHGNGESKALNLKTTGGI